MAGAAVAEQELDMEEQVKFKSLSARNCLQIGLGF